ncbi:glycosyltransferase WbuB [Pseudomonas sp. MWU12-2534b]|nr:glycosyltransferase WbuB [Pseudomonas sp. MWU12-2534b]
MDKSLRILVVTQYFWPENMRINSLVEEFVARGHKVTVLTGVPNYPEGRVFKEYKNNSEAFSYYHGAEVIRVPMFVRGQGALRLALNYLSFFVSATIIGLHRLRGHRFDSVFVYAVSPIMVAIPAVIIGKVKSTPVFTWVLDLWPETLKSVGVIKNRYLLGGVGRVVSWVYNRTDYLLLQSKSFTENVSKYCTKHISPARLIYFPSWAEDDFIASNEGHSDLMERDDSVFTVVFAGNLGEAQDFPAILQAVEAVKSDRPVRWVIVGDGRAASWLSEQVIARKLSNVILLGRHPLDKMPALFANADALLVSLKASEVFERTVPGKVQAYLASGKPIIAMIDGEAARVVTEAGAGMVCRSGDALGLASVVSAMSILTPNQLKKMGLSGKQFYNENYSKKKLFDRLEEIFRSGSLRYNSK